MNAPTSPLPASLLRAEADEHDLDARIEQAEQRLIAREEDVRRRVGQLSQRARQAWQPRKLLKPLMIAAAGVAALVWLWRRRSPPPPAIASSAPAAAQPARSNAGAHRWLHLLPMLWPLLPQAWRARVPAPVSRLVIGLGVPLLEFLFRRRQRWQASVASPPISPHPHTS